jgi:putative membrane-bound dehydrogenase-like protein
MKYFLIAIALVICIIACNQKGDAPKGSPSKGGLSTADALNAFELPEGFKIELVAAEPLISDPVAMEVDENGNMYVVELHGYPLDTAGLGKIKLLTDSDGDGAPDKSSLFADHLRMPTGIMKWKKGILVVDVPEILYLEDSDNDGKADIRKTMMTGIALTNPQHIANTPIFGLDNWIYLAHMGTVTPRVSMEFSDSGSIVRYVDNPAAKTLPRNADGRNIRFKPDSYEMEMLSGYTQYGQTFDTWGHHICTDNSDHLYHEVIPARYLQRNANLLVEDASEFIPDHGNNCEVYPITVNPENQLLTGRGIITSSCGVTWYQGGLFPDSFKNVTFIAEPVSNLVHADRINEKGATFTASRVYQQKEFLASRDGWFRPVQFYIGPDGALYVIDYYRQIVEHPEWMSEETNKSGALYNGSDKGRIYRVTPTTAGAMDWCNKLKLGKATVAELVNTLASNNIWWRRNAQRLLMDRKDNSTAGLLQAFLDTTTSAAGTVHALWTLEGLHAIDAGRLIKALHNSTAGVRENALILTELHLADFPQLERNLLTMQKDPSAKVRYQLLCTLGNIHTAASQAAQQDLLMNDVEDKWVQVAALTSLGGNELALVEKSIAGFGASPSEGKALFFSNCANLVGVSGATGQVKKLIMLATNNNTPGSDWWQSALLRGLKTSFTRKGLPAGDFEPEKAMLMSRFSPSNTPLVRSASIDLLSVMGITANAAWTATLDRARVATDNDHEAEAYRQDATRLLTLNNGGDYNALFEKIISSDEKPALRTTALRAYNKLAPKAACEYIVKRWQDLPRDLKDVAMNVFLSSNNNMNSLLDAIKSGTIPSTALSWAVKENLANNDDDNIRNRSRELIVSEIESREQVYTNYLPALAMKGDTAKGRMVFQTVCGICHQYEGAYGRSFGPDLGSIRNREKASIMVDILNPNRSIAVKYDLWKVTTKTGDRLSGIVSSETSAAVTLNQLDGQRVTVSRADIKMMETAEASAMPVGLENSVSKEQMANLLAFLTNKE